jgi:hypothetical protein
MAAGPIAIPATKNFPRFPSSGPNLPLATPISTLSSPVDRDRWPGYCDSGDMDPQNGINSTAAASTLNDNFINAMSKFANGPVSTVCFRTTIVGEAQIGGNLVYLWPAFVLQLSPNHLAALTAHAAIHNLQVNDGEIKVALGPPSACGCGSATDCISVKFERDCFQNPALNLGQ